MNLADLALPAFLDSYQISSTELDGVQLDCLMCTWRFDDMNLDGISIPDLIERAIRHQNTVHGGDA